MPDSLPQMGDLMLLAKIVDRHHPRLTPEGTKWCPDCQAFQPLSAFNKAKYKPQGRKGYCREHDNARQRARRALLKSQEVEVVEDCLACDATLASCSPAEPCCEDCTHTGNWPPISQEHKQHLEKCTCGEDWPCPKSQDIGAGDPHA